MSAVLENPERVLNGLQSRDIGQHKKERDPDVTVDIVARAIKDDGGMAAYRDPLSSGQVVADR